MPENTRETFGPVRLYKTLSASYPRLMHLVRFVISGGTATAVNLGALFTLTHFFSLWYLFSSIFAFVASFFVSFTLQKFWTFGDTSTHQAHVQAFRFFLVILMALGINTTLLFMFVEYAHLHYLLAQFTSGMVIAFINYFSYKHFVFGADIEELTEKEEKARIPEWQLLGVALAAAIFLSLAFYRLSENPPTWLDEGTLMQVSLNLALSGTYGLQTAPGHFVSANFLTTSFPVFYPVALSFILLGTTIFHARIVMVLFMTLLCVSSYALISQQLSRDRKHLALFSLFLLVTFAPLYGHGKNMLGEVPGLTFFVASLLFFKWAQERPSPWVWGLSGAFLGLSMVTKPLYLLVIAPTAFLTVLICRKHLPLKGIGAYTVGALAILVLWFFVHVGSIAVFKEILFSGNTNNLTLSTRLFQNGLLFVTQLQPLYFLGLLTLWWTSLLIRAWNRIEIPTVELYASIFAALNFFLYLASRGFYRYFFPAEVLTLIFFPLALYQIPVTPRYRGAFLTCCTALIALLTIFQAYQTLFHSWIAEFRDSTRSALLSEHLHNIPHDKSVFFYNVPEAVIFFPSQNYYQYLRYGDNSIRGEENLEALFRGEPDFVLVDGKFPDTEKISTLYSDTSHFDKYTLYERKHP